MQRFLAEEFLYDAAVVPIIVHWGVITNFSPDQFSMKYEHFTS